MVDGETDHTAPLNVCCDQQFIDIGQGRQGVLIGFEF
jgi:hypothetical protein